MRIRGIVAIMAAGGLLLGACGTAAVPGDTSTVNLGNFTAAKPDLTGLTSSVVTLNGGDKVAVVLPDRKHATIQRFSADAGRWTAPVTLYTAKARECGDLEAAAGDKTVAVLLSCDVDYAEDQAPTKSVALVSADLRTWHSTTLEGESFGRVGVSPKGAYAAFSADGNAGPVRWSKDGFNSVKIRHTEDSSALLIANDDGRIAVAGSKQGAKNCTLTFQYSSGSDSVVLDPSGKYGECGDLILTPRDADTILAGGGGAGDDFTLIRGKGDHWKVKGIAPTNAPGLKKYGGDPAKSIVAETLKTVDGTLISIGSPDRRHIDVQTYDDAAARWRAPATVFDRGFPGCARGAMNDLDRYAVFGYEIHCYASPRADGRYPPSTGGDSPMPAPYDGTIMLISRDGVDWKDYPLGTRSVAWSGDGSYVVVPGDPARLISARGTMELGPGDGACDTFFVTKDGEAYRIADTDGTHRGWPTALQRAVGTRWKTIAPVPVAVPKSGTCEFVNNEGFEGHLSWDYWEKYAFTPGYNDGSKMWLDVKPTGDSWTVVKSDQS